MAESVCLYKDAIVVLKNMRLSEYKNIKNLNNVHYTSVSYEIDNYPEALLLYERVKNKTSNIKNIESSAKIYPKK